MELALIQAQNAEKLGEIPVGCVIVKNNKVIASGHNSQITKNNPTAHAEIIALQKAGEVLNNYRLTDTVIYTTLEPCTMCFGAIIHARIPKIVFATQDFKTGVCGSCINLQDFNCFNHKVEIVAGVLKNDAKKILQDFFKNKRIAKNK